MCKNKQHAFIYFNKTKHVLLVDVAPNNPEASPDHVDHGDQPHQHAMVFFSIISFCHWHLMSSMLNLLALVWSLDGPLPFWSGRQLMEDVARATIIGNIG